MGASSWRYYTSHQPDPEEALQQLRRDVFARGEYSMGCGGFTRVNESANTAMPATSTASGATNPFLRAAQMAGIDQRIVQAIVTGEVSGLNAQERQLVEQVRPMFQMAMGGRFPGGGDEEDDGEGFPSDHRPETIDELLEMVAEDGTHSILDIQGTGSGRDFGIASPFPAEAIIRFFGTAYPTHEQVETRWLNVAEGLERWQAYYLTIYRDDKPHEYAFIGCSGD